MKKKVLITHAFGPDNRGDHELLFKLMQVLKEKYNNEVEFSIFTSFPEKSASVFKDNSINFVKSPISLAGINKSVGNYTKLFTSLFTYILYYFFNIEFFLNKKQKEKINIIREADVIFYTPGGYLYSNGRSYYANIVNGLLLEKSKASIFFSPMSIGPFYKRFDAYLCKRLLMSASKIFLRETYSYNLVKQMKFNNAHLTTDIAWCMIEEENSYISDQWENKYVITVIDWDYKNIGNVEFYRNRYLKEIIDCCIYLASDSGQKVILYNQVGSGKGNSRDERLIRKIVSKIPEFAEFEEEELTPDELKARLRKSSGIVASRFHSALFAIQVEIPFIALAYQPKTEYILNDLDLSTHYRQIHSFSGKDVAEYLISVNKTPTAYNSSLKRIKERARYLLKTNFYDLLS